MPKRRRTSTSDSEGEWSNFEDSKSDVDSDFQDASSNKKTKRRTRDQKVKKKKSIVSPRPMDMDKVDTDDAIHVSTHSKSAHIISSPGPMRVALLQWYQTVHDTRRMPWRKPFNPSYGAEERAQRAYEVWVSEIMLQQTQVITVIPYYTRWMEKYPTIRHLASANVDQVNALWKGLGYYSRASRLLAGAQKAVKQYRGRLPDNAKEMEANIPGIGRYSAGAICSIAYGEKVPVLDGNVHRLLSRVLALHAPPKVQSTLNILWGAATAMVQTEEDDTMSSPQYSGDINQALIELGSTVCKVRDPGCGTCPLQKWCSAYQNVESKEGGKEENIHMPDIEDICDLCEPLTGAGGVMSYPMKAERKKAREELDIVNVVEWRPNRSSDDRWFLFIRRPSTGLLAGLYEFPTSSNVPKTITGEALNDIPYNLISQVVQHAKVFPLVSKRGVDLKADGENLHICISKIKLAGDVVHVFSHVRKTYRVQWVLLEGGSTPPTLKPNPEVEVPIKMSRKGKQKALVATGGPDTEKPAHAMWVLLDDVVDVNMGTGVAKVWNLTQGLWEKSIDGD